VDEIESNVLYRVIKRTEPNRTGPSREKKKKNKDIEKINKMKRTKTTNTMMSQTSRGGGGEKKIPLAFGYEKGSAGRSNNKNKNILPLRIPQQSLASTSAVVFLEEKKR